MVVFNVQALIECISRSLITGAFNEPSNRRLKQFGYKHLRLKGSIAALSDISQVHYDEIVCVNPLVVACDCTKAPSHSPILQGLPC